MKTDSATVAELGRRLEQRGAPESGPTGIPRAAVAIVLREVAVGEGHRLEFLLIKRAEREGDPWSGQIALPGGREEPSDRSLEDTAVRETLEETGIDLARDGTVLGALADLNSRSVPVPVIVRPFVATLQAEVSLVLSAEVAAAFWVPLASITAPGTVVESVVHVRNTTLRVPSFRYGDHVVWGMTQRILYELQQVLEEPKAP